jgi:uncharacterized protein
MLRKNIKAPSAMVVKALERIDENQTGSDTAHDADHVRNVIRNCCLIFREVDCDQEIVLLAASLHDFVPRRQLSNPGDAAGHSADASRRLLLSWGIDEAAAFRVANCIRTASWEHHARGGVPADKESHVLRDADLLESIGARGIARMFAFAGAHESCLEWTNIRPPDLADFRD